MYLLPVNGSDTNWFKNVLAKANIQLSAKERKLSTKTTPISDPRTVKEVVEKFTLKYGPDEIKKYYSKLDVAVEVPA